MKKQQGGFTLIELIMVIVILGVLSAFALPKFADLGSDARLASLKGALGSVKSANAIAHAAYLAGGNSTSVTFDGVAVTLAAGGYPDADSASTGYIGTLAGLSSDYTITPDAGVTLVTISLASLTCSFTYTEATGAVSVLTGADC